MVIRDYADKLFKEIAESKYSSAEKAINRNHGDYFSKLNKYQKGAIFSMTYNAGADGLFKEGYTSPKKIREYIDNKDSQKDSEKEKAVKARTRAWYELRYNSCKEAWGRESTMNGLARRRYNEGDLFGLYDEDKTVKKIDKENDDKEIKSIYEIAKYFESNIVAVPNKNNVLDETIQGIEEIKKELENYNQKYGIKLINKAPIYNSTRKIQENTDILIFPLMYRVVAAMEKEADKIDDDELSICFHLSYR